MTKDERLYCEQVVSEMGSPFASRLSAIADAIEYGPTFDRNVYEAWMDAYRLIRRNGDPERWVILAEMRAGVLSFEEYRQAFASLSGTLAV